MGIDGDDEARRRDSFPSPGINVILSYHPSQIEMKPLADTVSPRIGEEEIPASRWIQRSKKSRQSRQNGLVILTEAMEKTRL